MPDYSELVERLRQLAFERRSVAHQLNDGTIIWYPLYRDAADAIEAQAKRIAELEAENAKLREALLDTTASLVASVSLLERGGKKAASSDRMFAQMLIDYKNSIGRARAALEGVTEKSGAENERQIHPV